MWEMIENIEYDKEHINKWKYIEFENNSRIYYKPSKYENTKAGFLFYCVNCVMWNDKEEPEGWECIFNGIARFDGIRHLYLGDEQTNNDGYLYYPETKLMILFLEELKKLEKEFCDSKWID